MRTSLRTILRMQFAKLLNWPLWSRCILIVPSTAHRTIRHYSRYDYCCNLVYLSELIFVNCLQCDNLIFALWNFNKDRLENCFKDKFKCKTIFNSLLKFSNTNIMLKYILTSFYPWLLLHGIKNLVAYDFQAMFYICDKYHWGLLNRIEDTQLQISIQPLHIQY